jgi:hypothetical protein
MDFKDEDRNEGKNDHFEEPSILANIKTEIADLLQSDEKMEGKVDWSECLTKFNRFAFLGSRHISGHYLHHKYRNNEDKIQLSSISEIDWEDSSFKSMIEGLAVKAKIQKHQSDFQSLENKLESIKSSVTTIENLKVLIKHYVKKEV